MPHTPRLHTEPLDAARPQRQAYAEALDRLIATRFAAAQAQRVAWFQQQLASPDDWPRHSTELRADLAARLGWPLVDGPDQQPPALLTRTKLGTDADGTFERWTVDVLTDLPVSMLVARPHQPAADPSPVMICQHGGAGTPELVAGFYNGNSSNYTDMLRRVLRRGYTVMAPQLMLWVSDTHGPPRDRQATHQRLLTLGSSITALEVFAIRRCLDALLAAEPHTLDANRVGMVGLSYGGFFTMMTAALEPRIRAAVISCIFRDVAGSMAQHDMFHPGMALRYSFAEITALIAPRPVYVEHGRTDTVIDLAAANTQAEAARAMDYFRRLGHPDRCTFHVHPGWHAIDHADPWLDFLCQHV